MPASLNANELLASNASATQVVGITSSAGKILTTDPVSGAIAWTKNLPSGMTIGGDASVRPLKAMWFNVGNGDGTTTTFTLPHNFGTNDVAVHVYENLPADHFREYPLVPTTRPTNNTVQLEFVTPPSLTQFRAMVVAAI